MAGLITGFCRAFTDYIINISDEDFAKSGMAKGVSAGLTAKEMLDLIDNYGGTFAAGGNIANSIAVAASLGAETAFIGKVACDSSGSVFREAFQKQNVLFKTADHHDAEQASGTCAIFVTTSDGERTMRATEGVSDHHCIDDVDLYKDELQRTGILFTDYPIRDPQLHGVFNHAAKQLPVSALIATTLQNVGSPIVDLRIAAKPIFDYAHIVFGNETEYEHLAHFLGDNNVEEIARRFPDKILCCTLGEKGAVIHHKGIATYIPVIPAKVVDTIGAGDAFAGGFLHGLNQGKTFIDAGTIAAESAAKIVAQPGARPS